MPSGCTSPFATLATLTVLALLAIAAVVAVSIVRSLNHDSAGRMSAGGCPMWFAARRRALAAHSAPLADGSLSVAEAPVADTAPAADAGPAEYAGVPLADAGPAECTGVPLADAGPAECTGVPLADAAPADLWPAGGPGERIILSAAQ